MARLRFCSFDYEATTGTAVSAGVYSVGLDLDKDFLFVSGTSDTTFYPPGYYSFYAYGAAGRGGSSGALGSFTASTGSSLNGNYPFSSSCAIPRSSIGSPSQIWVTCDISHPISRDVDDPTNLMRSEARYQVFKFGDLSLRIRSIANYNAGTNSGDITFEAFNGVTSLGTITIPSYATGSWIFCRIYAKLDGSSGQFDISLDGQSASYTSLNSVATTALSSVTHLYFSGGALGKLSTAGLINIGRIDNLLLDDAAFPSGRPRGQRVAIASDGTLVNWAPSSGGTLTGALSSYDAIFARGTGTGATALLNLTAPSTAGLNGVLGWQIHAYGLSNVDTIASKRLITGVDVSGTATNGTYISPQVAPATPSFISPGIDTIFYSSGTTDFTLASVPNTKLRLEVTA